MKEEYRWLQYRNGVSIVTYKEDKYLLVNLINWPDGWWKFPQGKMKKKETVLEGALREFTEEIGTDKCRIAGLSRFTNLYDWPDRYIERRGERWRGQFQRFVLAEFQGDDSDIIINPSEIKTYKWATREEIIAYSLEENHKLFGHYHGLIPKILAEFGR